MIFVEVRAIHITVIEILITYKMNNSKYAGKEKKKKKRNTLLRDSKREKIGSRPSWKDKKKIKNKKHTNNLIMLETV